MKYSIAESARIAGVTRKTFYKHIDKRGISIEKDENDNPLVDASELIRVYGDKCRFDREKPKDTGLGAEQYTPVSTPNVPLELAILQERLNNLEEQRNQYKELYEQERQERQNGMRLLTDQREKQNQWEKSFEQLRQQVLEREQGALKELETFKKETTRKLVLYRRALQAERDKTVWQKLFAPKPPKRVGRSNAQQG